MAATNQTAAAFTGFDRGAMGFWHELASEMNREWFGANKARYETLWVHPMQALLDGARLRLVKPYRPIPLAPAKVMRIHRDVRFARDKAPYKTHIAGVITVGGSRLGEGGNAALYVHLGIAEEFVGVGTYMFDSARLARWRKAVAGKPGVQLAALIATLRAKGYQVGGHDDYKRVPRPYDPDHPRAELLKMKGLTGGFPDIPRGLLHDRKLVDWLVTHGTAMAPLVRWLHTHVK